ncbi:hypothetical protein [Nocardioides sp. NPDC047086]|uniref:hypothetical protein n=1 Tax=Nocardioides sp. NPDC047086 TaxID=3154810 RepID=UPI0033C937EA
MKFRRRSLEKIGELICGNRDASVNFPYRSSMFLTEFFQDLDLDFEHDGSTRHRWVADMLEKILEEDPQAGPAQPSETFCRVIDHLMSPVDATENDPERDGAIRDLNTILKREGFEAFYADDRHCYLRHLATGATAMPAPNPHRPFTTAEMKRREQLVEYLNECSEDQLIEEILLPLLRQLGFHRITPAGHKDKALEYGKDVWMRYPLPTQHVLYFGIQAKRGKLDAAGQTRAGNVNVAEIYTQAQMMLAHEIFDPEINKRVLVDHAFIVAGGEITKQARNWLGNKLDANRRSQIMFMDREDLLNLYTVTNLPLPQGALPAPPSWALPSANTDIPPF